MIMVAPELICSPSRYTTSKPENKVKVYESYKIKVPKCLLSNERRQRNGDSYLNKIFISTYQLLSNIISTNYLTN